MKQFYLSIGTFVATTTFLVSVVLPVYTKSLKNEIAEKEAMMEKLASDLKEQAMLTMQLDALKANNDALKSRISQLTRSSVFADGSLYLTGYSSIVIGDSVSKVLDSFNSAATRRNDTLIEVSFSDQYMEHITYAYDFADKTKIGSIVYSPKNKSDMEFIIERFRTVHPSLIREETDSHTGEKTYYGYSDGTCISLNGSFYKLDRAIAKLPCV